MRAFCFFALMLIAALAFAQAGDSSADAAAPKAPPRAKPEPVEDVIHGHRIVDPYRWMENADSPETQRYVADQLAYTRSRLDPLPGRDRIHARLTELLNIGTVTAPSVAGKYFLYTRRDSGQNQPILYVREGLAGKDRVLVDANQLAADGTVALDWWYPTHDGKYVAYGLSSSGSEMSTLYVMEISTGRKLAEAIDRTRAASVAWLPDNSGFYYTRYPRAGEVPAGEEFYHRRVFFHQLGSSPDGGADALVFPLKEDVKPDQWTSVQVSEDGKWLLVGLSTGWTKTQLFLKERASSAPFVEITQGKEFLYTADFFRGELYIHSNEDAPRYRIFKVAAANPARANWREIVPQSDAVIETAGIVGGKIFATGEKNATSLLKVYSLDGKLEAEPKLPGLGTVPAFGGTYDSNDAFFSFNSFVVPPAVFHYDMRTRRSSEWARVAAPVDASPYDVRQVWYTSKDGTRVPMFIVARKGLKQDGSNPTLLTGYGGFNVSERPAFNRSLYVWLEHGGIYALANLRGGSEFGEDWHRAGMLDKKQNVFDDFIAAAEYLIAEKYTSREHLAIQGGSNGGLLVGAALTQRPDLYRAVICQVPLLDMLRYQNFKIAKLWVPEYGSAEDARQFDFLYAYSPYHHVKDGVKYPAVLLTTADSDSRVDPMHAKKMAARLQAANAGPNPILLRIEPKAGHGAGKPVTKQIEEGADIWSFLFWQLGVKP
ncbi:MAG TPA: prolyl oligopeptidase family serine peptidase [Terriglobales bacterium]|nr:prolyl oligopeptidase family serine peptidase [Terriglobales bacterium]